MLLQTTGATSRRASIWPARVVFLLIGLVWLQTAAFIAIGTPGVIRPAAAIGALATLVWCFGTAPEGVIRRITPLTLTAAILANAALWPGQHCLLP